VFKQMRYNSPDFVTQAITICLFLRLWSYFRGRQELLRNSWRLAPYHRRFFTIAQQRQLIGTGAHWIGSLWDRQFIGSITYGIGSSLDQQLIGMAAYGIGCSPRCIS
jgi:hypothetical protein